MVLPVRSRRENKALKILELGPGTGSVTLRILEEMREGDELTVCEINPRFMALLKDRLKNNRNFIRHRAHIMFHQCPAQELPESDVFDVIICALPFLNFELRTVKDIFAKLRRISSDDTIMTYYEYIGLRRFGLLLSPTRRKVRMRQLGRFFEGVFEHHLCERHKIWANMLPINVYLLGRIRELDLPEPPHPGRTSSTISHTL